MPHIVCVLGPDTDALAVNADRASVFTMFHHCILTTIFQYKLTVRLAVTIM